MERGSEWEEGDVVGGEDKEDDGGEEMEWEEGDVVGGEDKEDDGERGEVSEKRVM